MDHIYWHKQAKDQLLYPELLWSKPENKLYAGKLLIIGGNGHEFAAPSQAYQFAGLAGAGAVRVLLPDSIKKRVGHFLPEAFYGPSTHSGGFAGASLDTWLELAEWADATLLAGDIGRNSETSVLIEKFLQAYSGRVILTKDAIDVCLTNAKVLLMRPGTAIVGTIGQLQKYIIAYGHTQAIKSDTGLTSMAETLHDLTSRIRAEFITLQNDNYIVATNGLVSTTHAPSTDDTWQIKAASVAAVWLMQNPSKQFEALSTAVTQL